MHQALLVLCAAIALLPWAADLAGWYAPLAAVLPWTAQVTRWASLAALVIAGGILARQQQSRARELREKTQLLEKKELEVQESRRSLGSALDDLAETSQKLAAAVMDLTFARQQHAQSQAALEAAKKARDGALEALELANLALDQQKLRDPVTGLNNRSFFTSLIQEEAAQAVRIYSELPAEAPLPNRDLVFFLVEIDGYQPLQRKHGEPAARAVLQRTAQALRKATRESDTVLRWGDSSFLVLARSTSRGKASEVAERIRLRIGGLCLDQDQGAVRWTCSLGFAALPFQPSDPTWIGWERTLEISDACLAAAKKAGEGSWVGVQPTATLRKERHGIDLSARLPALASAGHVRVSSNRSNPLNERTGQVLG